MRLTAWKCRRKLVNWENTGHVCVYLASESRGLLNTVLLSETRVQQWYVIILECLWASADFYAKNELPRFTTFQK